MAGDFKPSRKGWYVQRGDYGREFWIIQTLEDETGAYQLLTPVHKALETSYLPGWQANPARQVISGNEPEACHYTPGEAQQLLDALWSVGLRPTRK